MDFFSALSLREDSHNEGHTARFFSEEKKRTFKVAATLGPHLSLSMRISLNVSTPPRMRAG